MSRKSRAGSYRVAGEHASFRAAELGLSWAAQQVAYEIAACGPNCWRQVWSIIDQIVERTGRRLHRSTIFRALRDLRDDELISSRRVWPFERLAEAKGSIGAGTCLRRALSALVGSLLDNAQEQLQRWKQKRKEREEREQQKRDRDQRHRLLGELREEMKKPARAPRQYQTFVPDTTEPERMDPREALAAALAAANVLDAGSGSAEPVSFEPEPVGMSWEMRLIDAELEAIDELDTGPPE